jgi:hypothetical protein
VAEFQELMNRAEANAGRDVVAAIKGVEEVLGG